MNRVASKAGRLVRNGTFCPPLVPLRVSRQVIPVPACGGAMRQWCTSSRCPSSAGHGAGGSPLGGLVDLRERYERDGFVIVPDLLSNSQV